MDISDSLKREILADIARCKAQTAIKGSETLYAELVSKYSVIEPNFQKGIPTTGKIAPAGSEFDYRREIRAIASKLDMWMKVYSESNKETANPLKDKIVSFISRGEEIKAVEFHPATDNFPFSYVSGPRFDTWMAEIHTFNSRHLSNHPLHDSIEKIYSTYKQDESSYDDMLGILRAIQADDEFFKNIAFSNDKGETNPRNMSNQVFIVHGHDDTAKIELARTLEILGFDAIILHEQASEGRTVIEKIEAKSDVAFGVVLYTECDLGRAKEASIDEEQSRARQNVVFEHGYLIGKLGRSHVCALVKGNIELPGDISGVVYIPLDPQGAWKFDLVKEMKAAGLNVDANNLLK